MSGTPTPVGPEAFRGLMGRWPTGVTVVTAHDGTTDAGLTVNAFLSLALDPPTVLVSLTHDVDTLPVLERSRRFAVSLLAAPQRAVSVRFAQTIPTAEKFAGLPFHRAPHGSPIPDGVLGAVECRVERIDAVHDHRLVVGAVEYEELGRDAPPLLFYHSQYGEPDASGRLVLPGPRR